MVAGAQNAVEIANRQKRPLRLFSGDNEQKNNQQQDQTGEDQGRRLGPGRGTIPARPDSIGAAGRLNAIIPLRTTKAAYP